jgi:hypothetical protein
MQLEPGNSLRATDPSVAEGFTAPHSRNQQRALVWAALLATLVAAALGWMPLHGLIFGRPPVAAPTAARDRTPLAIAGLPLSAQGQLSGLLAEDRPAFWAQQASGGYAMANAARTLSARFTPSGVSIVTAKGLRVNMSLRSLSEGRFRAPIGAVAPTAAANGVSYAHGSVREWYRNGPLGIEQGFDVERPPGGHGTGPLVLGMRLSANAPASLSRDGRSLTFASGSTSLGYDGLVVSDAAGRTLRSRLWLKGDKLSIEVDARQARFPLTVDPLIQQSGKLTSGEAEDEARFGTSAALSGDGNTLLIGAPQDNGSRGAVWVFVNKNGKWEQQGPKWAGPSTGTGGAGECAEEAAEESGECSFGSSVALSADGNTALVGEPSDSSAAGVAWVFTRHGTAWSGGEQLPSAAGEEGGQGRFGRSVALSADGDTALIGDPSAALQRGSASVFTRSSGNPWVRRATLSGAEARPGSHLGRSVAISADGSEALIGAPGDSGYAGAAWSFALHGSVWAGQGGKLVGSGEISNGHFGKSVAISGDGATAMVGGRDDNGEQGAVWPFVLSGESFVHQGEKLSGPPEAGSQFGYSEALSGDGNVALIGAPREESGMGTAIEYTRSSSSTWSASATALGGTDAAGNGGTGMSVALAQSGEVAAIGAPRDGKRAGAAWVFSSVDPKEIPGPTVKSVTPGHGPATGGTPVTVKGSNFTSEPGREPTVVFGSTAASSVKVKSGAELTAVSPAGTSGSVVDVTVQTPTGTSAVSSADSFKYEGSVKSNSGGGSSTVSPGQGVTGGSTGVVGVLGSTQAAGAACRVSLRSKRIVVASHRSAAIRLVRTGTGQCRGTLTLRYRQRTRGKHSKLRIIGSAHFSIAQGRTQVVRVKLNKLGKTMFVAGHGKLQASAAVLRTTPAPRLAKTASVRLSVKKKPKAATVAH